MSNQKEITEVKNTDLINLLEETSLLTSDVCESLEKSKDFILSTYTDVPMYRPLPIKLFGVLNDKNFPTPSEKFWQCKVEAEVHANELIRDIHDLEIAKIDLDRALLLINKIVTKKSNSGLSEDDISLLELDLRELNVKVSRKRFEIKQIEKRIKYRIDEVTEWKKISDSLLEKNPDISANNYVVYYANKMKTSLKSKLSGDLQSNENTHILQQIQIIDKALEQFS
jgi:hypothetical protein